MYTVEDYKRFIFESLIHKGIIEKCSNPKYFSRKTKSVMDKFRDETKDWNHEKVLYLDNDGNILWEKEGNNNSVSLNVQEAWRLSASENIDNPLGYGQINIEHNHPTIKGFEAFPPVLSIGDTNKMLSYANEGYLFRSITAEGNGKRMSLIRKSDFEAETSMHNGNFDRKKFEVAQEHLDRVINDYIRMYGSKLAEYNNMNVDEFVSKLGNGSITTDYDVSQRALDDIGSLRSLLDKEGVTKELDDCGIIIYLEE